MITVRLAGGLGNQMFQFAAGLALSSRIGSELAVDTADLESQTGCTFRTYGLDVFHLVPHRCVTRKTGWIGRIVDRAARITGNLRKESGLSYNPSFFKFRHDTTLEGCWQSPRYFEAIADQVRLAYAWKDNLDTHSAALLEKFRERPTVSVHFRRGDYVNDPRAAVVHGGVCTLEYYRHAIEKIRSQVPGVRVVAFSDDPEWVRECGLDLGDALFIKGNTGASAHIDMRLMTLCDHHIIANSTFSWWGAWLGTKKRQVIAPRRWFTDGRAIDIFPADWELI